MKDANIFWDVGLKNLSYIVYTKNHEILLWDVVDTNVRRQNGLNQIVRKLTEYFDTLLPVFQNILPRIHLNIIENQPTLNPLMRIISGIIGTYFLVKCNLKPYYYNPAYKLMNVNLDETFSNTTTTTNATTNTKNNYGRKRFRKNTKEFATAYRMRKRASIEETRRILQLTPDYINWLIHFETHKHKQDDLADTFLMARSYENSGNNSEIIIDVEEEEGDSDVESNVEESEEEECKEEEKLCIYEGILINLPPKKKKIYEESLEHYKFCLEERLHKEYGKNENLIHCIDSIVNTSKAKGIMSFKKYLLNLECTCHKNHTKYDIYNFLMHEPHWKTLFS